MVHRVKRHPPRRPLPQIGEADWPRLAVPIEVARFTEAFEDVMSYVVSFESLLNGEDILSPLGLDLLYSQTERYCRDEKLDRDACISIYLRIHALLWTIDNLSLKREFKPFAGEPEGYIRNDVVELAAGFPIDLSTLVFDYDAFLETLIGANPAG